MTQKEQLKALLREAQGQTAADTAEYLLANGVRVVETQEKYDYARCPHRSKDGLDCIILTGMICRDANRTMPCGFFPDEARRRADILELTGSNRFRPLVK